MFIHLIFVRSEYRQYRIPSLVSIFADNCDIGWGKRGHVSRLFQFASRPQPLTCHWPRFRVEKPPPRPLFYQLSGILFYQFISSQAKKSMIFEASFEFSRPLKHTLSLVTLRLSNILIPFIASCAYFWSINLPSYHNPIVQHFHSFSFFYTNLFLQHILRISLTILTRSR